MKVLLKVLRIQRDTRHLRALAQAMPQRAAQIIGETAQACAADVTASFSASSPAAPGQPPGVVSGELRASITAAQVGRLAWQVSAGAPYAAVLEYGVPGRLAARPFLRPAVRRAAAALPKRFGAGIKETFG